MNPFEAEKALAAEKINLGTHIAGIGKARALVRLGHGEMPAAIVCFNNARREMSFATSLFQSLTLPNRVALGDASFSSAQSQIWMRPVEESRITVFPAKIPVGIKPIAKTL